MKKRIIARMLWHATVAVLALVALVTGLVILAGPRDRHQRTVTVTVTTQCTWGASSVGPVTIENGKTTGSTVPSTSGCAR